VRNQKKRGGGLGEIADYYIQLTFGGMKTYLINIGSSLMVAR
jgi:hypothetical protein